MSSVFVKRSFQAPNSVNGTASLSQKLQDHAYSSQTADLSPRRTQIAQPIQQSRRFASRHIRNGRRARQTLFMPKAAVITLPNGPPAHRIQIVHQRPICHDLDLVPLPPHPAVAAITRG